MANDPRLEFAGITDPGLVRSQNEDAIAISPTHGFAILADGMGGYNAGEVASSIATSVVKEILEQNLPAVVSPTSNGRQLLHGCVTRAIEGANAAILKAANVESRYHGMGTTLIAAVFLNDKVTIAHVGDSRAYRFFNGELVRLTRDHSLLQEQIDAGLIDPGLARYSHNKNLVTRAVGVSAEIEVEIHDHRLQPTDIFLLCSDGLSDMLDDTEIEAILSRHNESLDSACRALVQSANDNGGFDNISVIVVRVQANDGESGNLFGRIRNWLA